jgi:hypothetical protein
MRNIGVIGLGPAQRPPGGLRSELSKVEVLR